MRGKRLPNFTSLTVLHPSADYIPETSLPRNRQLSFVNMGFDSATALADVDLSNKVIIVTGSTYVSMFCHVYVNFFGQEMTWTYYYIPRC